MLFVLLSCSIVFAEELMTIYEVPADYINLEIIKSDYIIDSKVTPGFPIDRKSVV